MLLSLRRVQRWSWCVAFVGFAAVVTAVGLVGGAQGARSAPTTAIGPGVSAWCVAGHEPVVAGIHHVMPGRMRPDMVMTPLTAPVCRKLLGQLAFASRAALRLPTLASARRAGYRAVGFYLPGMGLHMLTPRRVGAVFDPSTPTYLLYDGTTPTARISGLAYQIDYPSGAIPDFFVGDNDMPHSHAFCPRRPGWLGGRVPGEPGCTRANAVDPNRWMIHAWVVPGRPSPWGVFSSLNPNLTWSGWDARRPMTVPGLNCAYTGRGRSCRIAAATRRPRHER
jgi:hypothetical protein